MEQFFGIYELLGQITHVTDHVWSEQVSNFAKHERNPISGEYVAHKVDIPIPMMSYIKVVYEGSD